MRVSPCSPAASKGREKPNCEGEQHESPQSPDRNVHRTDHLALFLPDFGRDLRADNCAFLTWSRNRSSSRIRILRLVIVSLTIERRCSKILIGGTHTGRCTRGGFVQHRSRGGAEGSNRPPSSSGISPRTAARTDRPPAASTSRTHQRALNQARSVSI
jgi:hypothetical protein